MMEATFQHDVHLDEEHSSFCSQASSFLRLLSSKVFLTQITSQRRKIHKFNTLLNQSGVILSNGLIGFTDTILYHLYDILYAGSFFTNFNFFFNEMRF